MNVRGKQTQPLKSADQTEFNDRTRNCKVTHLNHECEAEKSSHFSQLIKLKLTTEQGILRLHI